jgi:hypothetical protein
MTIESSGPSEIATESDMDPFSALAKATIETFEPHVSSKFFADPNTAIISPSLEHLLEQMDMNQPIELELVEVTRYPNIKSRVGAHGREPFSLLFCGSHQQPLISAIYTVSHACLPDLNLFLNPVQVSVESNPGNYSEGLFYESCFT